MNYHDLLDFKNQYIVDELYKRLKNDQENKELDEVYELIKERNQTKIQSTHYQYQVIKNKVAQVISIIGWILFALLFIVSGSMILALLIGYFHVVIEPLRDSYVNLAEFGSSLILSWFPINPKDLNLSDSGIMWVCYSVGLGFILACLFICLYVFNIFRKDKAIKKQLQVSLKDSYHYLQCHEDDSWDYIKSSFLKRVTKPKSKEFLNHYYLSYIQIFENYQPIEGTIQNLNRKEQIKLCIFTLTNTIKNIFGAFSMPIYMSIAIIISYYQNFMITSLFKLELLLEYIPLGNQLFSLMRSCYDLVMRYSIFQVLNIFDQELAIVLSFCICMIFVWFLYTVLKTRIREIKRQYHRRLNFYLKKKENIYEEKKKYEKSYFYGFQFTVFLFFVGATIWANYANEHFGPLVLLTPTQKEEALMIIDNRDKIFEKVDKYAFDKKELFLKLGQNFMDVHIYTEGICEFTSIGRPYLKCYTYYNLESANTAFKENAQYLNKEIKTNKKLKIDYVISKDGFIIKDKGTLIILNNNEKLSQGLFSELNTHTKEFSEKEIKALVRKIGYKI